MNTHQIRFDTIHFPIMKLTPEGFLRGSAPVTKAGVFNYGVTKELRHPDDVFKSDSLASLKMIPVTNDHPSEMVNASNAAKYSCGYTGESYNVKSNNVIVTLTITDKDVIEQVSRGKNQISMGYTCRVVEERGTFDGQNYTHRQEDIIYNHVAIVMKGRAGDDIRLKFDSALESIEETITTKVDNMTEQNQSELQLKLDTALAQHETKAKEIELLNIKLEQSQLKIDSLEKSNIKLTDELNQEKAKRTDSLMGEMVVKRVDLLARASDALEIDAYIHHSDRDIMIAAINAKEKTDSDFKDCDAGYLRGRFDTLFSVSSQSKVNHNVFKVLNKKYDSASNASSGDSYFEMMAQAKRNIKQGK